MALKLHIIIGSTRPGRVGPTVARWFHEFATTNSRFDAELVDLADFNLPLYNEPRHPRLQEYEHEPTKAWSASVAAADAYVFVTPEYNYFAPPALVNALDLVLKEWAYKPAGLLSYGGVSGGLRAAQSEKLLLTSLGVMPLPEGIAVPMVTSFIGQDGVFRPNDLILASATKMVDELFKWAEALKPIRHR